MFINRPVHKLCVYLLAISGSLWILCFVVIFTRCSFGGGTLIFFSTEKENSMGRSSSSGALCELYGESGGGSSASGSFWRYQDLRNGTVAKSQTLLVGAVAANFSPDSSEGGLTECCSRLVVDAECKTLSKGVEGLLSSAGSGERSLYRDRPNLDTDPVECMLKNAPVKQVQLFSYRDGWFRDSIYENRPAPTSYPESGTSLPEVVASLPDVGSTHKWLVILEGGQRAIFKPQW